MIEIKLLNKHTLFEFIHATEFGEGNIIPISFHRAVSQMKNPQLDDEDVLLLLAYQDGTLVGYLGVLPDRLYVHEEEVLRVGWLSCIWVSESARGKGVSSKLIEKSVEVWQHRILFTDYVPATQKIYDRTNLFVKTPLVKEGVRLYIKSDFYTLLPPKSKFFTSCKCVLKLVDVSVNTLLAIRLKLLKTKLTGLSYETMEAIDEEASSFMASKQKSQLFKRNKEELNWIIQHPWILPQSHRDSLSPKYYFSSVSKTFEVFPIKLKNDKNQVIAVVIFTKRDNTLKLSYLYHDDCMDSIIKLLNHLLIEWKVNTFSTFHTDLSHQLRRSLTPAIYKKGIKRSYGFTTLLGEKLLHATIDFQDGDGDCIFT
jgi:GNAT superfamily N-acetyltransferase